MFLAHMQGVYLGEPLGYPAQPELISMSVCQSVMGSHVEMNVRTKHSTHLLRLWRLHCCFEINGQEHYLISKVTS
jgi:hypothetical protein